MELQRLVVEEPDHTFSLDVHPGLTIAFHNRPAVRARCVNDLLDALGPGRAGLHLELIDGRQRYLAVFRPHGGRPRVIDVDASTDVTSQFRSPDGTVDLLAHLGIDATAARRMLRVESRQLDRTPQSGTDNHRDANHLAGLDQARLWAAAEAVQRAEIDLTAARADLPGQDRGTIEAFDRLDVEHEACEATLAAHRPIQRLGALLAVVCVAIGAALLAFDQQVGDNSFTGRLLVIMGLCAAAVTLYDRRSLGRARSTEQALLAEHGAERFSELATRVGPLADAGKRRALVAALDAQQAAYQGWGALSGGIAPSWAMQHRPAIEALASQRSNLRRVGADHLLHDDSSAADAARLLVDRVIELQEVGLDRERLPLVLEEPFLGLPPAEVQRLLATLVRLAVRHQLILVTGDRYIHAWAAESGAAAGVALVELTGTGLEAATDPPAQPYQATPGRSGVPGFANPAGGAPATARSATTPSNGGPSNGAPSRGDSSNGTPTLEPVARTLHIV